MSPAKMDDLRHYETHLSDDEMQECRLAGLRQKEIQALGEKYACHLANAPKKGVYHHYSGARLQ